MKIEITMKFSPKWQLQSATIVGKYCEGRVIGAVGCFVIGRCRNLRNHGETPVEN
ncbi:hypothetical protein K0M31_007288 [Melipona bicolor]|uniref:Uncharacterized protein n=1 Tax=Melipona bicolor TaxID=60889 RepID=A0AA40KVI4_9HYME|nr:hypothetical protein K0M31_007288 [Melipona bicolor]